jgi:tRNA dimethylallyltransferase
MMPPSGLRSPALAVVGPTASGKTALSIPLARTLGAEIISLDSRQLYRGMDIGTDKASVALQAEIPHHGLDQVDPREPYSAGTFAREARVWMEAIRKRGHLPLLVGGTGFFLRALMDPIFREPPLDPSRRAALRDLLATWTPEALTEALEVLDPARLEEARAGGRQRLARALELPLLTGRTLSWWHTHAPREAEPEPVRVVCLEVPRPVLVARIDARVVRMFEGGLLAEVNRLLESGVPLTAPAMTATGYREAAAVLMASLSLEEAIESVQRATRAYARRQVTWFRHQLPPGTLRLDGEAPPELQHETVLRWWESATLSERES